MPGSIIISEERRISASATIAGYSTSAAERAMWRLTEKNIILQILYLLFQIVIVKIIKHLLKY